MLNNSHLYMHESTSTCTRLVLYNLLCFLHLDTCSMQYSLVSLPIYFLSLSCCLKTQISSVLPLLLKCMNADPVHVAVSKRICEHHVRFDCLDCRLSFPESISSFIKRTTSLMVGGKRFAGSISRTHFISPFS